ncbi:MAG: hypothetical protein VB080_05455 [Propionicimonas sp.]|nr:hypothetical protein [Propionicimonas sp.]MEA5055763.1 hypothetical protein [Propionicimonas sp.]
MSGWQATGGSPGWSLVEQRLLQPLLDAARSLGYTPSPRDVPGHSKIVRHFHNWNNAVAAAGLPNPNDPEQHRLRAQYRRERRARRDGEPTNSSPDGDRNN